MWEFANDKPDVDVVFVMSELAAAVTVLVLQTQCGVGGGAGQALMWLVLPVFESDGLRSEVCLNPLPGCNGYYRPAIRTQSRFSLLYQMPEKHTKYLYKNMYTLTHKYRR